MSLKSFGTKDLENNRLTFQVTLCREVCSLSSNHQLATTHSHLGRELQLENWSVAQEEPDHCGRQWSLHRVPDQHKKGEIKQEASKSPVLSFLSAVDYACEALRSCLGFPTLRSSTLEVGATETLSSLSCF